MRAWIILCCLMLVACDKKSPPAPPVVDPPAAVETITGTERIGWTQSAADAVELGTIAYVIYVDGARTALTGTACASAGPTAGFSCTAQLPPMPSGAHALELASFVNDGGVLESARSAVLRVMVTAQTAARAPFQSTATVLGNGVTLKTSLASGNLEWPTDVAFAPDGRLFVAERAGRIRIIRDGQLLAEPALSMAGTLGATGQLVALAIDPQFARTHFIFALYTEPSPRHSGEMTFTLARFRDVTDTLGDRAILLSDVPAASSPAGALRFGPDGKLYAALDDGGDPGRANDAASMNGKVLRLNADGTTPGDAAGGTPVQASGIHAPVAIDWDPSTLTLWVADRAAGASRFVFYRGALIPGWDGRLLSATDAMFGAGAVSGSGLVASAPDGAVYFATAGALVRLAPDRVP